MADAVLLMVLARDGTPAKAPPCEPADCLALISQKAAVNSVAAPASTLVGRWDKGRFLGGSRLYLFPDRTYTYTEWADILPETVYDKGTWTLVRDLLVLSSDPEVIWNPRADRRYLTLCERGGAETLLFGADRTLEVFLQVLAELPDQAQGGFRISSMRKARTWSGADASRIKVDLMKRSWRPCFFTEKGCPEPTPNCDPK